MHELTFHWARHTFGTLARNDCPMVVGDIAEALNQIDSGHGTRIFTLQKID